MMLTFSLYSCSINIVANGTISSASLCQFAFQSNPSWNLAMLHFKQTIILELKKQKSLALPLIPMNSTWFAKTAITTAFLGRLGELQLAAGTLGFTFANVTGFSILTGLCWAMEPICGQAHGANNHKLLHRTLLMTVILLLLTTIPISLLWLYMDKILILFGQNREITALAKTYVLYLLPDLLVTSFLAPLKAYLSSQSKTLPIMFSSGVAVAFHLPFNIFLSKIKGIEGVALATALTDLSATFMLAFYVLATESWIDEGWWKQQRSEWTRLLTLSAQCCFSGCLEWWCYEILILLAGRTRDAQRNVAVLTVVLNFDYLLYGVMVSLSTCASTRVSNELGAGDAVAARLAAAVSVWLGVVAGGVGGLLMVVLRGEWGFLFSRDKGVIEGVGRTLIIMAVVEVFNFVLGVCGGILRGSSRPWLAMLSVVGFYFVGLPSAGVVCFSVGLGVYGLLLGFLVGSLCSAGLLVVLVVRIDWAAEAYKVQKLVAIREVLGKEEENLVVESEAY